MDTLILDAPTRKRIGQIIRGTHSMETMLDSAERILDHEEQVTFLVHQAKQVGCRVVLTQGTFDLIHIGHARYVREARKHGDLLIVGVDSDEKARARKGENRPVVPLFERTEMLAHLRYVDAVVPKSTASPKWHLIKLVEPDTLIAVEGTYKPEEIDELGKLCGQVMVLPRQAETSTSNKARKLVLDGAESLTRELQKRIPELIENVYHDLKQENGS